MSVLLHMIHSKTHPAQQQLHDCQILLSVSLEKVRWPVFLQGVKTSIARQVQNQAKVHI